MLSHSNNGNGFRNIRFVNLLFVLRDGQMYGNNQDNQPNGNKISRVWLIICIIPAPLAKAI